MAWNSPRGNGRSGWNRGDDGDLDRIVRALQAKYGRYFGSGIAPLLVIGLVLWLATGIYQVDAAQQGVVLRFGALHEITEPGICRSRSSGSRRWT